MRGLRAATLAGTTFAVLWLAFTSFGDSEARVASAGPDASTQPAAPEARSDAEAETASTSSRRLQPKDLRALDLEMRRAHRDIMAGRYPEAIETYESALELLPAWSDAESSPDALGFGDRERYRRFLAGVHDNLGVTLMRAHQLEECAQPIEASIALMPNRAKFHHNLALCHMHGGRHEQAVAAIERAKALDDETISVAYDHARIQGNAQRCSAAIGALENVVDRLPAPDLEGRRSEAHYLRGSCLADEGRHAEAVAAFREALVTTPGHQKALHKLGLSLRRNGQEHEAEQILERFMENRRVDEELRAVARSQRNAQGRMRLAEAYLEAERPADGLREARMALAERPTAAAALVTARAYLALVPPAPERALSLLERIPDDDPARHEADALIARARKSSKK